MGHGVYSSLDDSIGNRWLSDPYMLRESRFLHAVKLRCNLCGTRQELRNVDPAIPPQYRQCGAEVESLAYVLNVCPANHVKIVRRRDDIKVLMARRLDEIG